MRRAPLVLLAAAALVVALTGCASTGVTAGRLSASVAPTFEHLFRWKQQLEGEATSKALDTSATCHRADPSSPNEGADGEWLCTVRFLIDGPNTQVSFNWNVCRQARRLLERRRHSRPTGRADRSDEALPAGHRSDLQRHRLLSRDLALRGPRAPSDSRSVLGGR